MSRFEAKEVWVQCYSGLTYADRPVSFIYQGEACKVERVEKEWREPGEKHFQICTETSKSFELCYNEQRDEWFLEKLG